MHTSLSAAEETLRRVGFTEGAPNAHWSKSRSSARASWLRASIAGVLHSRLLRGLSIEKLPPAERTTSAISTDRSRDMLPRVTRLRFSKDKSARPSGLASDLKRGGPPSSFRAAEKVLHGVPK